MLVTDTDEPIWIGGVPVADTDLPRAVERTVDSLRRPDAAPTAYRFVNAYSIALARHHADYRHLLSGSGVNFADGKPLARVARHLSKRPSGPLPHVRGPSYFELVLDVGRAAKIRHYFLGGTPDTITSLLSRLDRLYPGVDVAGTCSPPFWEITEAERADEYRTIVESGPDIIWVALGTPKQDFEAERLVERTGISAAAVGAAFDFLAGTKPAAPRWIRAMDVEWLFRLATEPRRLWRRYLIGNVEFMTAVLPDIFRRQRR